MVPRSASLLGGSPRLARAGRSPLAGLAIVTLCLLCQWPGVFSLPPIDRDEARFAQATRQIVEATRAGALEGMLVPRVGDRLRLNKPPLIYWVQGLPAAFLDPPPDTAQSDHALRTGHVWAYRLPSLLCAMLSALLTWRLGLAMRLHPAAAWLAGAFMAASLVQMVDARQARADQLLLAVTTAAQLCLWRVWDRSTRPGPTGQAPSTRPAAAGFWILMALGVLTKGPITPMVAGLCVGALCLWSRRWRWVARLHPLLGIGFVVAAVAAWVIPVAGAVGFDAYREIVFKETLGRAGGAMEGHWGPPGYHLVLLAVLLFPGTMFTAAGIARTLTRVFRGWAHTREDPARRPSNLAPIRWIRTASRRSGGRRWELFCVAWILPSWIVFELSATKLPHYTLPLYPAVALISARALLWVAAGGGGGVRGTGRVIGVILFLAIGLAALVAAPAALALWGDTGWLALAALVVAALLLIAGGAQALAAPLTRCGGVLRAHAIVLLATALASAITFGLILPHHPHLFVSSKIAAALGRIAPHFPSGDVPIGATGYREDSLIFLTRANLQRVGRREIPAWAAAHPAGVLIVQRRDDDADLPTSWAPRTTVRGFNYSKGQWVDVDIATSTPPTTPDDAPR